jgi:hypothetical protein
MTTTELRTHLLTLTAERAAVSLASSDAGSSDDLLAEIEAARHAFVGAAVIEIATFRAQLSGPQIG